MLSKLPLQLFIVALKGYKRFISPMLPPACRYAPTCSEYALEAFQKHGALRGFLLAARRILRCHPWGGSGYDPVPDKFCLTFKPNAHVHHR
jgi:putative membrane protein insertion efficiency factor